MSRLHMSSKSLPGVKEDMDNPDVPGDGREHPSEASVNVSSRSNLFLEKVLCWVGWGFGGLGKNLVKP